MPAGIAMAVLELFRVHSFALLYVVTGSSRGVMAFALLHWGVSCGWWVANELVMWSKVSCSPSSESYPPNRYSLSCKLT